MKIPEGWQLVPVEPTPEMREAGPLTMDWSTTILEYVSDTSPDEEITCQWTKGYEECKRRIHKMLLQPVNAKFITHPANDELRKAAEELIESFEEGRTIAIEIQNLRVALEKK